MTSVESTYYARPVSKPTRPALEGDHRADAVVIGGGYAGVSAALEFAEQGLSVILIERDIVAAGASGRNGGILLLSEGIHIDNVEGAGGVVGGLEIAAQTLKRLMTENAIDADVRLGTIRLATTERQAKQLMPSAGSARQEHAASPRFLDRNALSEFVRSDRYTGGFYEPENITLNPHLLLEGLGQLAERRGVIIAEGDPATGVSNVADGVVVTTPRARISASRLVVAAGAGTRGLVPSLRRKFLHGYSQIAVTAPLSQELLESVVPGSQGFSENIAFSRYFRRMPGNRLLFGISTLFDPLAPADLERRIRVELAETFPVLAEVELDSAWEGVVPSTREETPLMTRIGPSAVVTSSNGVLPSWRTGRIAALASAPEIAEFDGIRATPHGTWPPLGMPESLMRRAATTFLRLKDGM